MSNGSSTASNRIATALLLARCSCTMYHKNLQAIWIIGRQCHCCCWSPHLFRLWPLRKCNWFEQSIDTTMSHVDQSPVFSDKNRSTHMISQFMRQMSQWKFERVERTDIKLKKILKRNKHRVHCVDNAVQS